MIGLLIYQLIMDEKNENTLIYKYFNFNKNNFHGCRRRFAVRGYFGHDYLL